MSDTYISYPQAIPSDEGGDIPLFCEDCDSPMWLTQVRSEQSDSGHTVTKKYECKACGGRQKKVARAD